MRRSRIEKVKTNHACHHSVIFNKVLVDKGANVLNHKAEDRHEIVVKVIDKFKLNWFYFTTHFHLCLNDSVRLFLNLLNSFLIFCLLLLFLIFFLFPLLRLFLTLLQSFHVILHYDIKVQQIKNTGKEDNRLSFDIDISRKNICSFFLFVIFFQFTG